MRPRRETFSVSMLLYLAVGCGAAIGALFRFLSGVVVSALGLNALVATGFVNIVGSCVIGFFATLSGPDGRILVGPAGRQFVMAGLCGGFTTFSSMSLETFVLMLDQQLTLAAVYLGVSVLLSLVAVWLGHAVATVLNDYRGQETGGEAS